MREMSIGLLGLGVAVGAIAWFLMFRDGDAVAQIDGLINQIDFMIEIGIGVRDGEGWQAASVWASAGMMVFGLFGLLLNPPSRQTYM